MFLRKGIAKSNLEIVLRHTINTQKGTLQKPKQHAKSPEAILANNSNYGYCSIILSIFRRYVILVCDILSNRFHIDKATYLRNG